MNDTPTPGMLDELLEPLRRFLDTDSARRVAELRIAPRVQERIRTLAERANDGVLDGEERLEYEVLINTADLITSLKLRAARSAGSN